MAVRLSLSTLWANVGFLIHVFPISWRTGLTTTMAVSWCILLLDVDRPCLGSNLPPSPLSQFLARAGKLVEEDLVASQSSLLQIFWPESPQISEGRRQR